MGEENADSKEKALELATDYVEEKPSALNTGEDEVGYREYLESLDVEFSWKEERWVRWKLDVGVDVNNYIENILTMRYGS